MHQAHDHRRIILVTGRPGVGKTTLVERIFEHYSAKGLKVAGMTTREVREGDHRVGFRIADLFSGTEGWLARVGDGPGPRIGRYSVVSEDLEKVGVTALMKSADNLIDMVLVDEIGPMEMTSISFRNALAELLRQDKIIVATVKQDSRYPEVEHAAKTSELVRIEVSKEDRDGAFHRIASIVDGWIADRSW